MFELIHQGSSTSVLKVNYHSIRYPFYFDYYRGFFLSLNLRKQGVRKKERDEVSGREQTNNRKRTERDVQCALL